MLDENLFWERFTAAIRLQPPTGENPNEYFVCTKPPRKRCNRIQIFNDHLTRISDGPTSKLWRIPKDAVLWYAVLPQHEANHRKCIINLPGQPKPYMGSIVCTMLDLLPEYEYKLPGQVLVYDESKALEAATS
jgi:hypothetical protein